MVDLLPTFARWFAQQRGAVRAGIWMSISALCYSVSAVMVRHLSGELPTFEIVCLRNLFGMAFMMPWLLRAGTGALHTKRIGAHIFRGCCSTVNLWCLFGALAFIPVADMAAINFLQPIFTSVIAILVLHELASGRRWMAVLIGFVGAMLIIRPGFQTVNIGIWLALGSSCAGAVVAIMIKHLVRTETPDTTAAYLFITQTTLSLIPALLVWQTPTLEQLLWFAALGYVSVILQRTFNRAMAAADATIAMPFNFTRLIWAAVLGFVVFGELPDGWTWAGALLIFGASLMLLRKERAS